MGVNFSACISGSRGPCCAHLIPTAPPHPPSSGLRLPAVGGGGGGGAGGGGGGGGEGGGEGGEG